MKGLKSVSILDYPVSGIWKFPGFHKLGGLRDKASVKHLTQYYGTYLAIGHAVDLKGIALQKQCNEVFEMDVEERFMKVLVVELHSRARKALKIQPVRLRLL